MPVKPTPTWVWFVLLTVIAAGVRGYGLGDDALWFDEAYSFWFSSQSLSDLWTIIPTIEPHPPLYYTGLKFWRVFGDSEAALRSLSVLFSAATVPAIIIFGRLAGSSTDGAKGAWIGYGAALLFALSPLHIAFAQQARPYAALTFFAALAMCGTAWLITHPEQATKPLFPVSKAATNHRAWAALIGGTAISLWLHNLAVLLPAALVVAGVSFYLHGTHNKAGFVRNAAIASGAVLLLWAPFLPWLWVQSQNVSAAFWIPALSLDQFSQTILRLFSPIILSQPTVVPVLTALFLALSVFGVHILWRRDDRTMAILLAALTALPLLLEVLISVTYRPVLIFRSLMWCSVPFYVLVVIGVGALPRPWMRATAFIAVCLAFIGADRWPYAGHLDEGWDRVAALIAAEAAPKDVVFFVPNSAEIPFAYYYPLKVQPALVPLPAQFPAVGLPNPYPAGQLGEPALSEQNVRDAVKTAQSFSAVWLITRMATFDPGDRLKTALLSTRPQVKTWNFNAVTVYRYQ